MQDRRDINPQATTTIPARDISFLANTAGTLDYYREKADQFVKAADNIDTSSYYPPFLSLLHGRRILDAGCGSGRDAAAFSAQGFDVVGIDASLEMVKATKAKGVNARVSEFTDMTERNEYNGIWAMASLLHIPHKELPEVVGKMIDSLKDNGIVFATVKGGDGEGLAPDGRFFSYFSQKSFENYFHETGRMHTIRCWIVKSADSSGKEQQWINYLGQKTK